MWARRQTDPVARAIDPRDDVSSACGRRAIFLLSYGLTAAGLDATAALAELLHSDQPVFSGMDQLFMELVTFDNQKAHLMYRSEQRQAGSRGRSAAAIALRDMGGWIAETAPGVITALTDAALHDDCPAVRRDACEALGNVLESAHARSAAERWREGVCSLEQGPDAADTTAAVAKDAGLARSIAAGETTGDWPVRPRTFDTMAVVDALVLALSQDDNEQVHFAATTALLRLIAAGVDISDALPELDLLFAANQNRYGMAQAFHALLLAGRFPSSYQPAIPSEPHTACGPRDEATLRGRFACAMLHNFFRVDPFSGAF